MQALPSFAKSLSHTAWRGVVGRTSPWVNAFGNAIGESLAAGSDPTRDPSSAQYENEMDRQSDAALAARERAYGGPLPIHSRTFTAADDDTPYSFGGASPRLGAQRTNLAQVWGQMTNESIDRGARAWGSWDSASRSVWAAQDAQAQADWQRGVPARNARADAYRQQLAREAFNFSDNMDARDIRLNSFSYKSRLSAEMGKIDAQLAYRASLANLPGMTAWDGVTRVSAAENYLRQVNGGLDPMRANHFQFQVAQSLPDAVAMEVGGLALARGLSVLGRAATPIQGFVMGERSVLMSQLNAEVRVGLQNTLSSGAPVSGITRNVDDLDAVWLSSQEVRQSQQSVSYLKNRGAGYSMDDISRTFASNPGDPRLMIDVVRMPDGGLTSLDNTRIAVLNAQGGGQILGRVRAFDDPLIQAEIDRFTIRGSQPRVPETWGDAVTFRIEKQGDQFRNLYPYGTTQIPKITGTPAGSVWSQYKQFPWQR